MAEIRKREVAYKMKIGSIIGGEPIIENIEGKEKLNFILLGSKQIQRVNVVANVIDKFISESSPESKGFGSLTIDDASGQIQLKVFGEDISKIENLDQGDTVIVIGLLRSFNKQLYIIPEIIKKVDIKYLLVRKLELELQNGSEKSQEEPVQDDKKIQIREQIINLIRESEEQGGITTEDLILKVNSEPEIINSEITRLLEEGIVYQPRPGRIRYLG